MVDIQDLVISFSQNFNINDAIALAKPLGLFILGLAVYSYFIFKFYRFLARREIFELNIGNKPGTYRGFRAFFHGIMYIIKYVIMFPLFLLFWVIILSVILAFLAKNASTENILLISVSLVGVIRFMAYYNEDLSKDLAKMMPFALLGVFLVDVSYFSSMNALNSVLQLISYWKTLIYYLIILIVIEFTLRMLYLISLPFRKKEESIDEVNEES